MVKIKIEIASGLQGTSRGTSDLKQIGFAAKMVDRAPFGGNAIDRLWEAEAAHVRLDDLESYALLARLFASEAAHIRGKVEGKDFETAPSEFDGVGSGATTELAYRPGALQNGA